MVAGLSDIQNREELVFDACSWWADTFENKLIQNKRD